MPQVNELKFIAKCKCVHPVHIEVEALKISGCYALGIGMKTVGNGRENLLTVIVPILFCRERERERELRTGKRIRYYRISGTEHIDREHVDYDREISITIGNTIHVTTSCN